MRKVSMYHLSNTLSQGTIQPRAGGHRHGGEDPRAVGKAVVWLSDEPMSDDSEEHGRSRYRHVVEVNLDDPALMKDEKLAALFTQMGEKPPLNWYFTPNQVTVVEVLEWNDAVGNYVSIWPASTVQRFTPAGWTRLTEVSRTGNSSSFELTLEPGDPHANNIDGYNPWRLRVDGRAVRAVAVEAEPYGTWVKFQVVVPP